MNKRRRFKAKRRRAVNRLDQQWESVYASYGGSSTHAYHRVSQKLRAAEYALTGSQLFKPVPRY